MYRQVKTESTAAFPPGETAEEWLQREGDALPDFDKVEPVRIGPFPNEIKEEKGSEMDTGSSFTYVPIPKAPRPSKVSQPEQYLDAPWRLGKNKSNSKVSIPRSKVSNVQVHKHKSKPFRHR
tara:strand:+ start:187 stop:552 length:366 start_codon:yes stop_codon:yes gene_type:complete